MYLFKGLKGQQFPNGPNIRFGAHEGKRILEMRLGLDLEGGPAAPLFLPSRRPKWA